jgi:hypothetical protein
LSWWVDGVQNTSVHVRVDIPGVRFGLRLAGHSVGSGLPDLELTLPRAGAVRILVANAAGRTVIHETRGASRPGPLRVPLGGGMDLANGVYFARAEFQGDVRSVRFTIVR